MVDRFEAIVYEHTPECGGRVVKMIGDDPRFELRHLRPVRPQGIGSRAPVGAAVRPGEVETNRPPS
jgi:hypothetical protein